MNVSCIFCMTTLTWFWLFTILQVYFFFLSLSVYMINIVLIFTMIGYSNIFLVPHQHIFFCLCLNYMINTSQTLNFWSPTNIFWVGSRSWVLSLQITSQGLSTFSCIFSFGLNSNRFLECRIF